MAELDLPPKAPVKRCTHYLDEEALVLPHVKGLGHQISEGSSGLRGWQSGFFSRTT